MDRVELFPAPKEVKEFQGYFDLTQEILMNVSTRVSREASHMIRMLQAVMRETVDLPSKTTETMNSIEPKINKGHLDAGEEKFTIMVCGKEEAAKCQSRDWYKDVPLELKDQAYFLWISKDSILIEAFAPDGLFYGITTLKQIIISKSKSSEQRIPLLEIIDYPSFPIRAQYLGLGNVDPYLLMQVISDHIIPNKFNFLFLEVAPSYIEFKDYNEFRTDFTIPQKPLKDIVAFCKSRNLEVVPICNFFGHQVEGGLLKVYPELAEDKNQPWAYCPSNPKVYKIAFDLTDQILDIFKPRYFHIGHDEIVMGPYGKSQIGSCPKCKGKKPPKIFADDIMKYYRHLKERGVTTMIWGDQFLNPPDFEGADGSMYGTVNYPAIDLISKDIIICDWHYGTKETYPTTKFFVEKGFRVIGATCVYDFENIEHFSKYACGFVGKGVMGMMNTFWGKVRLREDDTSSLNTQGESRGYITDYAIVSKVRRAAQCFWEGNGRHR